MNILGYSDIDVQRLNYIGAGHAHMIKGSVTKRIYQKILEVVIYDNKTSQPIQYIKIEGFSECPEITESLVKSYLSIAEKFLFHDGIKTMDFTIKNEKCSNKLFSRY
jgi:hypothetical protein